MAFHHSPSPPATSSATHAFYTEAMGFTLDRVDVAPTPEHGWARHVFYDTGNGEMIAFWDIHDDPTIGEFDPSISTGLGLPAWTNHIAFDAPTPRRPRARPRTDGSTTAATSYEIDHGWCTSIYTTDPNGIMVEFCCTTAPATDADRAEALAPAHGRVRPSRTPPKACSIARGRGRLAP